KYGTLAQGVLPDVRQINGQGDATKPVLLSEYGGIRWSPDDSGWGYGDQPHCVADFIARYRGITNALLNNPQMCGFCYTQLYDVEQEKNGLYTYDRQPKFDLPTIKAITSAPAGYEGAPL
ncbi:MAG TPA: beta-galactosidase, partial [Lactobacillus sp.]|nr:beta-galactosidase [Lactobacillus sp.]